MSEATAGTGEGMPMRNPELHRLQAELAALQRVDPGERDARTAADLELVRLRLDFLAVRAGIPVAASPYLAFLDRVRGTAPARLAASA